MRDMAAAQGNLLQRKMFIFWDDNLTGDRDYAKALFRAIAPLGKRWIAEATLHDFTADAELVELAAKSGCRGLFCGIESFNQEALRGVRKGFNKVARYRESIQLLHDHGICVDAGMMIGFDEDDESIFDRTLETAIALDIDIMNLVLVTPYPATKLFAEMASAGRLLHRDWSRYDGHHVVFRPAQMSPDGSKRAGTGCARSSTAMGSIARRVWRSGAAPWIVLPHNLSTRRFVRMESRRFDDEAFEYSTVVREIRGAGPVPAFEGGTFDGGAFEGVAVDAVSGSPEGGVMKVEIINCWVSRYRGETRTRLIPPLTAAHLAALCPDWVDVSIRHEQVRPVDYDTDADLVALSFMTGYAPHAYRVAERFRARGKTGRPGRSPRHPPPGRGARPPRAGRRRGGGRGGGGLAAAARGRPARQVWSGSTGPARPTPSPACPCPATT